MMMTWEYFSSKREQCRDHKTMKFLQKYQYVSYFNTTSVSIKVGMSNETRELGTSNKNIL